MTTSARGHANIHLSLDLGAVRADGLREVRTVLQALELGVRVTVSDGEHEGTDLTWAGRGNADPALDSARRAALRLFDEAGIWPGEAGVKIHITDDLGVAGRVGARSAVVGPLLRALDQHLGLGHSLEALEKLAGTVVAEGAFSVRNGTSLAQGPGEAITRLPSLPIIGVVIAEPRFPYLGADRTDTAFAFYDLARRPRAVRPSTDPLLGVLPRRDWHRIAPMLSNAFEPVLFDLFPMLAGISLLLRECGCFTAHLDGGGPCIYGLCDVGSEVKVARHLLDSGAAVRAVPTRTIAERET